MPTERADFRQRILASYGCTSGLRSSMHRARAGVQMECPERTQSWRVSFRRIFSPVRPASKRRQRTVPLSPLCLSASPGTIAVDIESIDPGISRHITASRIEVRPVVPDLLPSSHHVAVLVHHPGFAVPVHQGIRRHASVGGLVRILLQVVPGFIDILPAGDHRPVCPEVIPSCGSLIPSGAHTA